MRGKITVVLLLGALAFAQCEDDATVTRKVEFSIEIGGVSAGKIVLGVFGNAAPKTVTNFVALAGHEVS